MTAKDCNHPARQFFGAYFYPYWRREYNSYQAAIDDFVRQARTQTLEAVLAVID